MALIGNGNIARKIKGQYIGVDNIARKVTKGYIGVNNVAQLWFSSNVPLTISYSGAMETRDENGYRYFLLSDSGVFSVSRPVVADMWVCGGGGVGGTGGKPSSTVASGGGGGGGGHFSVLYSAALSSDSPIPVTIGAGGTESSPDGGTSSIGNFLSANGGTRGYNGNVSSTWPAADYGSGGYGGSGGGGGYNTSKPGVGGAGGGNSTKPFYNSTPLSINLPCAGGGGATASDGTRGGDGGSDGASGTAGSSSTTGSGGSYGGGKGGAIGNTTATAGSSGSFYGAGGGGGGAAGKNANNNKAGGNGYSGLCVVRIPLSEFAA